MTEDHSMMSNQDRLVYMANQIARNFMTMGEDKAAQAVADHIAKFWEPRMRRQFFEVVDNGGGDLLPLVIEASRQVNRPEAPAKAS